MMNQCPSCGSPLPLKKEIKPRFTAEKHDCDAYFVQDNDAEKYNMEKKAVAIYFKTEEAARKVANLLCDEWYKFLANPT